MTKIVNLKTEPYDVYIGRPSKWGNPFSHLEDSIGEFKVSSRAEAIEKHKKWIVNQPELMDSLIELKNMRLGCYCKPKKCHGDNLIELINKIYPEDTLTCF